MPEYTTKLNNNQASVSQIVKVIDRLKKLLFTKEDHLRLLLAYCTNKHGLTIEELTKLWGVSKEYIQKNYPNLEGMKYGR